MSEPEISYETKIPNLAGVATKDLVEQKGGGSFSASYINWARTLNLLRAHAPGWMVEVKINKSCPKKSVVFQTSVGGYLLIRFRNIDGAKTTWVPQAVMDNRNHAVPVDKITARDITDTHRRGACMAASVHFGLAYELWAKDEMESGYHSSSKSEALAQSLRDIPAGAKKTGDATAEVDGKPSDRALPDVGSGVNAKENGEAVVRAAHNRGGAISSGKISKKNKEPDPDRGVGNVYEAIERIKNCKTVDGAKSSMESSVIKYKFSMNDRRRMKEAVEYRISGLTNKGD